MLKLNSPKVTVFKGRWRSHLRFVPAAILGASFLASSAGAQDVVNDQVPDNSEVTSQKPKAEKIGITGSRIKKLDMEGPKSMIVLDAEALSKTGAASVNEALNTLTVASFDSATYGSNYGSGEGVQSISLHGLGSGNTLVLLNGKRLAKDPYLQITDLSVIPVAAVERVEILKGTASAIYGSDALGGVVNIITKKDFNGFGFGGSQTNPRYGTGDSTNFFAVSGTSTGKIQNLTVVNYENTKSSLYQDKPWVDSSGRSSYGATGSYLGGDGKFHTAGTCSDGSRSDRTGEYCEFNYFPYLEANGSSQKISLINDFHYIVNNKSSVGVRVFANQAKSKSRSTPTVLDPSDGYAVQAGRIEGMGADLAVAPGVDRDGNVPIQVRLVDGTRTYTENENLTLSATASYNYEVTALSSLEFSVTDSRVNLNTFWNDRYNEPQLKAAVNSGEYNVFAAPGDRGDLSAYKIDAPMAQMGYVRSYDLIYSGDSKWFGYSVGSSVSEEGYRSEVSDQTRTQTVKDLGGGGGRGERKANAFFAEVNVPLMERMVEFDLAARLDDYNDFGSTFNPYVGALVRPTSTTLVKARYGTGFKAPSLNDINGEEARYYNSVFDYKNCNAAKNANNTDDIKKYCDGNTGVETIGGGNKDLKPETTVNYSLFIGYEPVVGMGLSTEYWHALISDEIDSPDSDEIMKLEAQGKPLPEGVSIERDVNGDLLRVISPTTNLAATKASGLDSTVYWNNKFSFGTLGFTTNYSYMLSYQERKLETSPFEERLSENGFPRWRWNNTASYGLLGHTWALSSLSRAGYQKNDASRGDVGSFTQYDFNWTYNHDFGGTVQLGGRNIFNHGYPLDETDGYTRGGTAFGPVGLGPTYYAKFTQTL